MIFTAPIYLLALLGIPIIVLLHFVRRQRRTHTVSSTLLWVEVKREFRRRFLINRFFRNILLLLQLLLITIIALALANPTVSGSTGKRNEELVVLVDTSASMGSEYLGESRLLRAQRQLSDMLDSVSGKSQVLVVAAGSGIELVTPGPVSPNEAQTSIRNLVATGATGDMAKALIQTLALTADFAVDRMVVATDGAYETPNTGLIDSIEYLEITDDGENAGITAFSFRTPPNRKSNYELLLQIESNYRATVNARITVTVDGELLYDATRTLLPERTETIVAPYDGLTPTSAVARIHLDDGLEADNIAYAVFDPDREIRVLLVSEGNAFLEKALEIYPNVELEIIYEEPGVHLYDLMIFDRYQPPPIESGSYLFIASAPNDLEFDSSTYLKNPAITGWIQNHPILDGIRPAEFTIYQSLKIPRSDPRIESIVHAGEDSLMWTFEYDDVEAVGLSFDITGSDLPLRADFPVLIANILSWLDSGAGSVADVAAGYQARSGDTLTGSIPGAMEISVRRPDGSEEVLRTPTGEFSYPHTDLTGIYRFGANGHERLYAVSVISPEETDIRPEAALVGTGLRFDPRTQAAASSADPDRRRAIWNIFAVLAIILICGEWLLWRRREAS